MRNDMKSTTPQRPAVFFDKDGTLVENVPYNVDCDRIRLVDGAGEAVRMLHGAGYVLVIVTNQSGIALGYFDTEDLLPVRRRIVELLAAEGVPLAGFYFCPHRENAVVADYARACDCRKPLPGMMLHAARDLNLDLRQSWIVGDILDDIEAGHRAGCRAVLLDTGGETRWQTGPLRVPEFTVATLPTAARRILAAGPAATAFATPITEVRS